MATVTGLTAQRMAEIEGQSVVDGEVVGNDLVLTKHNGQTINAGNVRGTPGEGVAIKKVLLPAIKLLTNGPGSAVDLLSTVVPGYVLASAWSPDQRFIAFGSSSSPYISVYNFTGESLTKISNPTTLPTSSIVSCEWSPDSRYLAVASLTSPYVLVYRFDGTSLVKLANPTSIPTSSARVVRWSPYGTELIVGTETSSPYFYAYSFKNETLSPITLPAVVPTSNVLSASWHPEGNFVSIGVASSPFLFNYSFDGLSFTKVNTPAVAPSYSASSVSFSPNGLTLAVGTYGTEGLLTYSYNAGTLTKEPTFNDTQLSSSPEITGVSWSPDSSYIAISHGDEDLRSYVYSGSQIVNVHTRSYGTNPGGAKKSVAWSPDGQFVASTGVTSPGISIQRTFAKYIADGTYTYAYR